MGTSNRPNGLQSDDVHSKNGKRVSEFSSTSEKLLENPNMTNNSYLNSSGCFVYY